MRERFPPTRDRLRETTAPALLLERARREPDAVAFRAKRLGLYRERTWKDYAEAVARAAAALDRLGLKPGERVAIMGDPCEEWAIADLAAQALGAIVYGIYPTASAAELDYQMRDGGAVLFVAEDQEYVDKLLGLADGLAALRHIVVIDATAMFAYDDRRLLVWHDLVAGEKAELDWLAGRVAALDPKAPAFIVYTSGTTGAPKGAVVAHGKHLAATVNIVDHYPLLAAAEQRTLFYLPLCHVLGRDVAVTLPLLSRLVPHYGEDPEDLATTLYEVAPEVLFTVPRYLQKFASQVLVGIAGTSGLKRAAYELAVRLARRAARARWRGAAGPGERALAGLARALVLRPILNKLGFDRLRLVVSGGAPLPAETAALWQIYGVNVVEMYGQTETAGGIIAGQRGPFPEPGTVGTVPDGWQVTLADDGEILVASPDLFDGYWNNPAAGADSFDAGGFLRTGDIGEWTGNGLRLIDRARDFLVTAGGKTIAPAHVENVLRASPYLSEVVVFGHARKYLTALVEIDFDMVADWARANDVAYSGFTSLAGNARVVGLIGGEIARLNGELARVEQVKAFRVLPKMLDPEEDDEPVTPTRKVKRALMYEKFRHLVEEMYDDSEERLIAEAVGTS